MKGASNVKKSKDRSKATIQASFDILLEDYRSPLRFYDGFFESAGWKNPLVAVHKKFPGQFSRPPNEDWSSFAAAAEEGSYRIRLGSLWQNEAYGANATVKLTLTGIEGAALKAHVDVLLVPNIDLSPFLDLVQLGQHDPRALLRLAEIAGGDPFRVEDVNIQRVRSTPAKDELTSLYLKAIDSIAAQIADFSRKHLPAE